MAEGHIKSPCFPATLGYIIKISALISALHVLQNHKSCDTGFSRLGSQLLNIHSVLPWDSM